MWYENWVCWLKCVNSVYYILMLKWMFRDFWKICICWMYLKMRIIKIAADMINGLAHHTSISISITDKHIWILLHYYLYIISLTLHICPRGGNICGYHRHDLNYIFTEQNWYFNHSISISYNQWSRWILNFLGLI